MPCPVSLSTRHGIITGTSLGGDTVNPRSLIAVRILTGQQEDIDACFLARGGSADAASCGRTSVRRILPRGGSARADGLSGSSWTSTAETLWSSRSPGGVDGMRTLSLPLSARSQPEDIVLRNDTSSRALEGLGQETRVVSGETSGMVEFEESGIRYRADVLEGQKTGFFFDQRGEPSGAQATWTGPADADCFCYVGALGVIRRPVIGADRGHRHRRVGEGRDACTGRTRS